MTQAVVSIDWRLRERRGPGRKSGWQTSGGVVIDLASGRVALVKNRRERREGRSGWTWPKGRIDPGEGPLYAAIREIREECGVVAEPLALLGARETARALRHYYLLTKISDGHDFDCETIEVRWVSITKAKRLLDRKRDRSILKVAKRMIRALRKGKLTESGLAPAILAA